ncbi:MAG: ferritin [Clostridiales bacterium]|nr:ferritin [Clostridiales bacterium]MDD7035634.1 ferritin [Bacillota bacterium]MDY2920215.1 ferritin [Lentihominibacter sp.]
MLSKKVTELLNKQVNAEFYSAYLYLDFSNYYKDEGLDGYSNWYYIQAQEERDHAMLFIKYLQQNGESITLEAIDKPDKEYKAFIDPLNMGAEHERLVTSMINEIYAAAYEEHDFRTMQFLDWFVKEQAEEEDNADDNVKKFELFGSDSRSLYELDTEMKNRVYTAPSLVLD